MEFEFILLSPPLVWSTPLGLPGRCGICMHQHSTNGIRRITRIRRWLSTYWHIAQCEGVGGLLWWIALNDIIHDIRKRNVTIRSEIWAMIRFLGFRDIKEWVILWRLILRSLGCIWTHQIPNSLTFTDFGSKSRISQSQCEGRQLCVQSLFVILVSQLLILFTEYGH